MAETMIGVSGAYINVDETYSGTMKGMKRRAKFYCATISAVNAVNTICGSVIDQWLLSKGTHLTGKA